jgi:transcriptional regulator with XRE-family HTH domain
MANYHWSHMTAARLKSARAALKWSQRELGQRSRVHYQSVKYWERKTGVIDGYAVDCFKAALSAAGYTLAPPFAANTVTRELNAQVSPKMVLPKLCGAKTRKGVACRLLAIRGKDRCKFHGGLSTGPKTAEGKQRIAEAQRRRWQRLDLIGAAG